MDTAEVKNIREFIQDFGAEEKCKGCISKETAINLCDSHIRSNEELDAVKSIVEMKIKEYKNTLNNINKGSFPAKDKWVYEGKLAAMEDILNAF